MVAMQGYSIQQKVGEKVTRSAYTVVVYCGFAIELTLEVTPST